MNYKLIQSIKNNTSSITLQKMYKGYRVDSKKGTSHQYWIFASLKEALDKFNQLTEVDL